MFETFRSGHAGSNDLQAGSQFVGGRLTLRRSLTFLGRLFKD